MNLSSDKEQEFFSDGMTEEITAALAKVTDLRVVARTSAFEFKGKNVNIKTMGEELGATHLIEGSVRKAGDRVRITAQLIKADDGTHIWAEDYDRQLTDVFQIQEDIARAITASLRMPLGLKPGENLVNNRSIDPESHQQFLRAAAIINSRALDRQNIMQASALLEQIVARNPDYAPAWSGLAVADFLAANTQVGNDNGPVDALRPIVGELLAKADAAARRAIALDPNLALAYDALGLVLWARSKPLEADELFLKGLALDPNDWPTLAGRASRLSMAGHVKEGLVMVEQVRVLEPFLPNPAGDQVNFLWLNGRNDEAIALAKTLRTANQPNLLARIYASMGRYKEAADALAEIPRGAANFDAAQIAIRLLRMAPAKFAAQELPRLPPGLEFVYLYVGAPQRVMDSLERRFAAGDISANALAYSVWHPGYAAVRKTQRFKAYVRAVGYVDFWRAKGWPEFCHPTTGDDFACN